MTNQQHPVTPPPELVEQWVAATQSNDCIGAYPANYEQLICIAAARWGADQELKACYEWVVRDWTDIQSADMLLAARRPKPPSLKEQALGALYAITSGADDTREFYQDIETIKTALEQLDD